MKKEIRKKISDSMIGKTVSQTTKEKMSKNRKGIKSGKYEYDVHFKANSMKEIAKILGFSATMIKWTIQYGTKMDGHNITITRNKKYK